MNGVRFRKLGRTVCAVVLTAGMLLGEFTGIKAEAATPSCEIYNGENEEAQNYNTWSSPMESYLTTCSDGRLMRVQWVESLSELLVEYYDSQYNLKSTKKIKAELPIFGGFYETAGNYYIFSGRDNPTQSNETEVFRLTKYDKNWNKKGAASLYGANTYGSMHGGSCRMTSCGKYILIRTCHTMYKASDGYNHQANVTIEVDSETMEVTDSYTGVMNVSCGYVSHSFNQFITMDGNHIVAVDHGDAYPRSVVLQRYTTDASTGKFYSYGSVQYKSVLDIYGSVGDNATGVSLGGFEMTDSAYLVVGNSIQQDGSGGRTRNIFVASTEKNAYGMGETSLKWITDYAEGETSASTPQLVRLSDESFMLLWSRDGKVYYTLLDKNGSQTGKIYSRDGHLSDCKPIVSKGKVIWYTWKDSTNTFYDISISNPAVSHADVTVNGHDCEKCTVKDGVATVTCKRCGKKVKYNVPTQYYVWWQEKSQEASGAYQSWISGKYKVGDTLKCYYYVQSMGTGAALSNSEIEMLFSNNSVIEIQPGKNSFFEPYVLTMKKAGTVTVTFRPKYNPELKQTFNIEVEGEEPLDKGKTFSDKKSNGKYKVISQKGSSPRVAFQGMIDKNKTTVTIPNSVSYKGVEYKVTEIAKNAFYKNTKLAKAVIAKSVSRIADKAFSDCTKLKTVEFKSGSALQTIEKQAFNNCKKLQGMELPDKVETIADSAFSGCTSLQKMTLGTKVKKIGVKAFYNCSALTELTVKSTKLSSAGIGKQAFTKTGSKKYAKLTVKIPGSKWSAYKSLFQKKGMSSKVKFKKL